MITCHYQAMQALLPSLHVRKAAAGMAGTHSPAMYCDICNVTFPTSTACSEVCVKLLFSVNEHATCGHASTGHFTAPEPTLCIQ